MTKEAEDRGDKVEPQAAGDDNTDLGDGQAGSGDAAEAEALAKAEAAAQADIDAAEKAAKDAADKAKAEHLIPKSRFDEAVGKARKEAETARAEAEALKAAEKARQGKIDAAKVEKEIDELEGKLDDARADGNKELAKAYRAEIRAKQQDLADSRAEVRANYAVAQAVEQVRFDGVVSAMEQAHPELDPTEGNEAYDQTVVDEIQDLKDAFEAKGDPSSVALHKAVKLYYKGATPKKAEEKAEDDAGQSEADKKIKAAEAAAKLKEAAVRKARDAAAAQAAAASKGGKDSDSAGKKGDHDISKMTDAELDKLDPRELKRMRGDEV